MARLGMLIDTRTCIGCLACTVACKAEHNNPPGVWLAPVVSQEIGTYPDVRRLYVPLLCMHCDDPACVRACPAGAISKRPDGVVAIDGARCCGSGACVLACPYGAIRLPKERTFAYGREPTAYERAKGDVFPPGTAQKCDLCAPRLERGLAPACVEACPTESRVFGDLDDPESDVARRVAQGALPLAGRVATGPAVFYSLDGVRDAGATAANLRLPERLQTTWGDRHALEFTLLGAGGGLAIWQALVPAAGATAAVVSLVAAAMVAAGGLVLVSDLGRPLRFARALRNQAHSWIARGAAADFAFLVAILAAARWSQAGSAVRGLDAVAAVLGLVVALYPALAMRALRAVRNWQGWPVPAVFLIDAVASGATVAALIGALTRGATGGAADVDAGAVAALAGAALRLATMAAYRRQALAATAALVQAGLSTPTGKRLWRVGVLAVGVGVTAAAAALALVVGHGGLAPALAAAALATCAGAWADKRLVLLTGVRADAPAPATEFVLGGAQSAAGSDAEFVRARRAQSAGSA